MTEDARYWTTREGEVLEILTMPRRHAANVLAFLRRRSRKILAQAATTAWITLPYDASDMTTSLLEREATHLDELSRRATTDPTVAVDWVFRDRQDQITNLVRRADEIPLRKTTTVKWDRGIRTVVPTLAAEQCPLCGVWECADCGQKASYRSRFSPEPQRCPCGSQEGQMLPTRHRVGTYYFDHEDHYVLLRFRGEAARYPLTEWAAQARTEPIEAAAPAHLWRADAEAMAEEATWD